MKYNILLILQFLAIVCLAQQTTFSKVFSNYPFNPENAWDILEIPTGYLLVSANSCFNDSNLNCSSVMLLDFNGDIVWITSLAQGLGYRESHVQISDDRIYVSGLAYGDEDFQYGLSCLDIDGNLLWQKQYGNPQKTDWTTGLLRLENNNMFLWGSRDRNENHMYEWLPTLIRVNAQGDSLAEYTLNTQYDASVPYQMIETIQEELLISYVYCPDGCALDLKAGVTCLDSTGNVQWVLDLPYSYLPNGCLVNQLDSNKLAVKWYIDSNVPNYDLSPPAIFYTDMQGNIQDTLVFMNQSLKEVNGIKRIWEDGLVGCGREFIDYFTISNPPLAGWIFRIGNDRQIMWERLYTDTTYRGEVFLGLNKVIPTSDGGYLAVGTINNYETGVYESHNWVLKLDAEGCLEPGCSNLNYITDTKEPVFLKGKDIKIYPNPASEYAHVELPVNFDLNQDTHIVLLSNSGGTVWQQKVNTSISQLNLSGITSGMYYLTICQGDEIIGSKRIIVQH